MAAAAIDQVLDLFTRDEFSERDVHLIESTLNESCVTARYGSVNAVKRRLAEYLSRCTTAASAVTVSSDEEEVDDDAAAVRVADLTLKKIAGMRRETAELYARSLLAGSGLQCTRYRSMRDDCRTQLIYHLLKPNQRVVFERVHQLLSDSLRAESAFDGDLVVRPTSVCIDSAPGTGKSFLICAVAATMVYSPQVLVYQRALVSKLQSVSSVRAETVCKFLMLATGREFEEEKRMFNDRPSLYDMLTFMYRTVFTFPSCPVLVVLDEYTVVSPWFLVLLLVAGKAYGFNVICTGDKNQHNAIQKSRYHLRTNHAVVERLADHHMVLDRQMRIVDKAYHALIREYKARMNAVDDSRRRESVPNTFANLYYLFTRFTQKFFVRERLLDVVYMSQYHRKLRQRQLRIVEHLDATAEATYHMAPFQQGPTPKTLAPLHVPDASHKFLPYLLLVVGQKYVWSTPDDRFVVRLLHVHEDHVIVECGDEDAADRCSTSHRSPSTGVGGGRCRDERVEPNTKQFVLRVVELTHKWHNIPDEHFEWLKKYAGGTCIWQYPLRLYLSTYHAAQGLTMSEETVELDLDTVTANSIYVGLSRVTRESQIHALRTRHLTSLMYTRYKDDEYYYKLGGAVPTHLHRDLLRFMRDKTPFSDATEFRTCTRVEFEKHRKGNSKVLRSEYANGPPADVYVTELVSVGMFLLHNVKRMFQRDGLGEVLPRKPLDDDTLIEEYKQFVLDNRLCLELSGGGLGEKRAVNSTAADCDGSRSKFVRKDGTATPLMPTSADEQ